MKLEFLDVSSHDAAQAWQFMHNSPVQRVIHNELVKKILEDRDKLEKCALEEVSAIQQRLLARRELLGFIHRADKPQP